MKKLLLSFAAASSVIFSAGAQLNGDGYYRVQNHVTARYIYITDNKGKIDIPTTSVDALAIQLWKGDEKAASDPATVLHISKVPAGRYDYDVTAQGTGIYEIIGYYLSIFGLSDGTYYAYGRNSGTSKYLGDADSSDSEKGSMSTEVKDDRRKWNIKPVSTTGDSYFGALPTVDTAGKHYAPFYASFPFSPYSDGVKVYAVTKCDYGMAVAEEVKGTVPAATPCFIECPDTRPSGNRLNVGGTGTAVQGNLLGGVYFENYMNTHLNLTPYDKKTMRVLGTLADGSLGYLTADIEYLPANRSYLKVPEGSPASLKVVSRAEYDAAVQSVPTDVRLDRSEATLYAGSTVQLRAEITPADAVSNALVWTSSDEKVAEVSGDGVVRGISRGTAVITVSTVNGLKATCDVTVNAKYPESLSLNAAGIVTFVGVSAKASVVIAPEDVEVRTVSWSTADTSVATVDADGNVTGVKVGTTTLTATAPNGVSASCKVTVGPDYATSVSISPARLYINSGESTVLEAVTVPAAVRYNKCEWSSSDETVVTVDETGRITAVKHGNAVITVTTENGLSATCDVTVGSPLPETFALNISNLVLEVGDKRVINVKVKPTTAVSSATWASSDESVATVSRQGQVTALGVGEAVITATSTNGLTATCTLEVLPEGIPATSLTVSPGSLTLDEGATASLSVAFEPENVTNTFVAWSSGNDDVATVDESGLVTAVGEGQCLVYAISGSRGAFASLTVRKSSGVDDVTVSDEPQTVYTIEGVLLYENADAATIRSLAPGFYIVGKRKLFVR